jgi:hypothetical protein
MHKGIQLNGLELPGAKYRYYQETGRWQLKKHWAVDARVQEISCGGQGCTEYNSRLVGWDSKFEKGACSTAAYTMLVNEINRYRRSSRCSA